MTFEDEGLAFATMKLAMTDGAFGDLLAHVLAAGNAHSTKLDAVRAWFLDLSYIHT